MFTYDADNRVVIANGQLVNGSIVLGNPRGTAPSYENSYDAAGNVVRVETIGGNSGTDLMAQQFSYDLRGERTGTWYQVDLTAGQTGGIESTQQYDAACGDRGHFMLSIRGHFMVSHTHDLCGKALKCPEQSASSRRATTAGSASPCVRSHWSSHCAKTARMRWCRWPPVPATRLRESGLMSWDHYHVWRSDWDQYIAALPKPSDGFATPAEKTVGRSYSAARLEFEKPTLVTNLDRVSRPASPTSGANWALRRSGAEAPTSITTASRGRPSCRRQQGATRFPISQPRGQILGGHGAGDEVTLC